MDAFIKIVKSAFLVLGLGILLTYACSPTAKLAPLPTASQNQTNTGNANAGCNLTSRSGLSIDTSSLGLTDLAPIQANLLKVQPPVVQMTQYGNERSLYLLITPIDSTSNANYVGDYAAYKVCLQDESQCISGETGKWFDEIPLQDPYNGTLKISVASCATEARRIGDSACGSWATTYFDMTKNVPSEISTILTNLQDIANQRAQLGFQVATAATNFLNTYVPSIPHTANDAVLLTVAKNLHTNPRQLGAIFSDSQVMAVMSAYGEAATETASSDPATQRTYLALLDCVSQQNPSTTVVSSLPSVSTTHNATSSNPTSNIFWDSSTPSPSSNVQASATETSTDQSQSVSRPSTQRILGWGIFVIGTVVAAVGVKKAFLSGRSKAAEEMKNGVSATEASKPASSTPKVPDKVAEAEAVKNEAKDKAKLENELKVDEKAGEKAGAEEAAKGKKGGMAMIAAGVAMMVFGPVFAEVMPATMLLDSPVQTFIHALGEAETSLTELITQYNAALAQLQNVMANTQDVTTTTTVE